jgi:hypothetical protein
MFWLEFLPPPPLVVGFAWSNDPESYTSGSLATGRASYARQATGDVLHVGGWAWGCNPTP